MITQSSLILNVDISFLVESNGIWPVGAYRTPSQDNIQMRQWTKGDNTYQVAFLSYVQEISGEGIEATTEAEREYAVRLLDPVRVQWDVARARSMGAHLVIVDIGWADERPENYGTLLNQLVNSGADIIAGWHPETVEPISLRNINGQSVLLMPSLGNALAGASQSAPDTAGILVTLTYRYDKATDRLYLVTDENVETVARYSPTWLAYDNDTKEFRLIMAGVSTEPTWLTDGVYPVMREEYQKLVDLVRRNPLTPVAE